MNTLSELIDINYRERHFSEVTTIGGVLAPLIKMKKWDLYLYGAALTASNCVLYFSDLGVPVKGIIDSDERKKGTCAIGSDVPYIHITEIKERIPNPDDAFIIIVTRYFAGIEQVSILQTLIHAGFDKIYALNSFEVDTICGTGTEWVHCKRSYFIEHIEKTSDYI